MKFAHEFQESLIREGFPAHWVQSAVPYGPLKKVIKKVKGELEEILKEIGLDPAELVSTQAQQDEDARRNSDGYVAFHYDFDGDELFRPKLTLYFEGDEPVDAALSADTKKYLQSVKSLVENRKKGVAAQVVILDASDEQSAASQDGLGPVNNLIRRESIVSDDSSANDPITREASIADDGSNSANESQRRQSTVSDDGSNPLSNLRRVEIPLSFDGKFFELLQGDLTTLDALQAGEQKAMTGQITELSKEITRLTAPSKFAKTDMYQWRALFDIYLQACIFFSSKEQDHGSRTSTVAARKLEWFQSEVTRQGLHDAFKLPASRQAFARFVTINITLLQNLKFQEINQKAIGKILKKFDKRTRLGAVNSFPKLIQSDAIMSETMAKAVCAQVTEDIVKITPQLDDGDYCCPICSTVAWRPIRLECQHVLCSKCTVELQRTFKYNCPMCRKKQVVKRATEDNIDEELIKSLKKYFPKETREKRIELETIDGIARFGPTYKHPSEDKCAMM